MTANKIRDLARAKDMAVANEDYDEAKRLKASIDRLRVGKANIGLSLGWTGNID